MSTDLYHEIYTGEIFQKSNCIWHENTLMDFFRSTLKSLGYKSTSDSNKVWERNGRRVIVCLVDDFSTCVDDYSVQLPYAFDRNDIVITDNRINIPAQYQVLQLPTSFYGIYAHTPDNITWNPDRRFNFAVNRLDFKRLLMFLELQLRSMQMPDYKNLDYVNFNCWSWDGDNSNEQGLIDNVQRQFDLLEPQYQEVYAETFAAIKDQMPFRNHTLTQEQSHISAWMNIVMETYSSDTTVAVSEKIFRALCLPVPWQVYSGKYTVAYLNSIGLDTLQDLQQHKYDVMIENRTAAYGDKMVDFLFEATETVEQLQSIPTAKVQERLQNAAEHNQQLLKTWQQQWPTDFATWWADTVVKL